MIKGLRREWIINRVSIAISMVGAFLAGWKIGGLIFPLLVTIFVAGMVQRSSMSKYEKNNWQKFLSSMGLSRTNIVNNHYIFNGLFITLLVTFTFVGHILSYWFFNQTFTSNITVNGQPANLSYLILMQLSGALSIGLILASLRSFIFFLFNRRMVTYMVLITIPTMIYVVSEIVKSLSSHIWIIEERWSQYFFGTFQGQLSFSAYFLGMALLVYGLSWGLSLMVYKRKDL